MNKSFNAWWLLPVITLVLGSLAAFTIERKVSEKQLIDAPVAQEKEPLTANKLLVTQVALPPAPIIYQPTLTATIENNKVVVSKENSLTTSTRVPKQKRHTDDGFKKVHSDQSALAAKFNQVMQDMENEKKQPQPTAKLHAQALTLYPQWYQDLVPDLEFSSHIYSSNVNERWVRVNNQVVKEGELINADMRLVTIEPQQVIIEMQQRRFSLSALSNW